MKKENTTYSLEYTIQFEKDIEEHKKIGDKAILNKIDKLLNEIRNHPFEGTGKPEPLNRDLKGYWSRRITGKHRLIYKVKITEVTVMLAAAYNHYDDK